MKNGGVRNTAFSCDVGTPGTEDATSTADAVKSGTGANERPPSYHEVDEKGQEDFDPWALTEPEQTGKPWKGNFSNRTADFTRPLISRCCHVEGFCSLRLS